MKLILNELSINGQFSDLDAFGDYIVDNLKNIFDILDEKNIYLYKKSNTYECMITSDKSLREILYVMNDPTLYFVRKAITQLSFDEPYWDGTEEKIQSKKETCYLYPGKSEEPNCMTEAIEREIGILSFPSFEFGKDDIECSKDGEIVHVANICDVESLLNGYLLENLEDVHYVLEHMPYDKKVELFVDHEKCYAKEALLYNNLTADDKKQIVKQVRNLIHDKSSGRKSRWWDSIGSDIFEYRVSVSDGREFRILFLWNEKLIFLNGFIKKTRKTPQQEIEKAKRLKKICCG